MANKNACKNLIGIFYGKKILKDLAIHVRILLKLIKTEYEVVDWHNGAFCESGNKLSGFMKVYSMLTISSRLTGPPLYE